MQDSHQSSQFKELYFLFMKEDVRRMFGPGKSSREIEEEMMERALQESLREAAQRATTGYSQEVNTPK